MPRFYFNVDHIIRMVLDRAEAKAELLRLIVCDLSTSPTVDLAGGRMFLDLHAELAKRGKRAGSGSCPLAHQLRHG